MDKKQDKPEKVVEPPNLQDISNLFPPSAPSSPSPVANVSMKLPVFWPDAAKVWFAQADAQFGIRSVNVSKTKFYQTVAVLSQEVVSQILDLIHAPPAGDPYGVLQECLITLYTLNNYQRFKALVSLPFSGDQKPSHLMNIIPKTAIITPFEIFEFTSSGLHPLSKHTTAIRDFPPPTDKPGLQQFLGMINFYRWFLHNATLVLAPLTNAIKGPVKSLQWSPT